VADDLPLLAGASPIAEIAPSQWLAQCLASRSCLVVWVFDAKWLRALSTGLGAHTLFCSVIMSTGW
jgi:hypothetical protein